eukprot:Plantae.Rhodophyta-Rhodochaete_pulchella.ctg12672.p1 GENE.Plantae.Rhodophyta-Rhodochaete_pulchella.ctg12672~~Plantae.Rhodophyta-Rhodochaete_pulchella.ctg12672.p1  ORF type:complete len:279 (+),score=14.46 Plantae.Rhodophyta-Rhodochaete_pulchella.ctg12672:1045-1881(+)
MNRPSTAARLRPLARTNLSHSSSPSRRALADSSTMSTHLSPPRRLVLLDLNGILLFRCPPRGNGTAPRPTHMPHDMKQKNNYVYFRPHARSFVEYMLHKFDVGIWSSARKDNIDGMLNRLLTQEQRGRLVLVWGQEHCRRVEGAHSLENPRKPLFVKELFHVFNHPHFSGRFNVHNTILIDDSPEKTSSNVPYTCFHPPTYIPSADDNYLGPDGPLRAMLNRFSASPQDVQSFLVQELHQQSPSQPDFAATEELLEEIITATKAAQVAPKSSLPVPPQ